MVAAGSTGSFGASRVWGRCSATARASRNKLGIQPGRLAARLASTCGPGDLVQGRGDLGRAGPPGGAGDLQSDLHEPTSRGWLVELAGDRIATSRPQTSTAMMA